MCSNFGLNLHPGRPPAEIENRVYRLIRGWIARVRVALYFRRKHQSFWN